MHKTCGNRNEKNAVGCNSKKDFCWTSAMDHLGRASQNHSLQKWKRANQHPLHYSLRELEYKKVTGSKLDN